MQWQSRACLISLLDIRALSPEDMEACRRLLDKKFWACLEGKDPWGVESAVIFAAVARSQGSIIGIALATFRPVLKHARVLSLSIETNFRHQQIGIELLKRLETSLLSEGCTLTSFIYQTGLPTTAHLESILHHLGWNNGRPFLIRCHYLVSQFNPLWLYRKYKLPPGYEIFFWRDLTPLERQFLLDECRKEQIPSSISPFQNEATIEPINSLGLRKEGFVVGWIIINRIAPDTLKYSSLYLRPNYRFFGYAIHLLTASIILQKKAPIENAYLELNIEESSLSWIRFVKNRLVPEAVRIERFNESEHFLAPPDDESRFI